MVFVLFLHSFIERGVFKFVWQNVMCYKSCQVIHPMHKPHTLGRRLPSLQSWPLGWRLERPLALWWILPGPHPSLTQQDSVQWVSCRPLVQVGLHCQQGEEKGCRLRAGKYFQNDSLSKTSLHNTVNPLRGWRDGSVVSAVLVENLNSILSAHSGRIITACIQHEEI